ncbi:Gfo/Idh/MocA family protein [Microvirga thermotolerans]|uniref:Gfo/Idh/MocA family oxidoreductase n=1 Tax=Microvirga thermotolerans TaxID=2651334 RepID=A0A5P9K026_9HYPH|nr:Gfo/Idh/MocA family oxidoreductase [Microvirga thermotolerans]QFU17879.1 gfo/Idh/MocA family oxidoreductase [Microvirga thermotolerans]
MIGIGVVGYGYWGPNLARCVSEAEGSRLAGIADLSPQARKRAAARYPAARIEEQWQSLVADPAIDALIVATPTRWHFEIALAALRAGKHVLIEKPIASSAREAGILIEEAARRGLTLMVDHTFVYTGAVQKIRELVSEGAVGDIYYYDSTRINLGLFQSDVNVIWDLAVHDLAILDYVLDARPLAVSATGAGHIKGSPENMAHITLYLEGGATAYLNVNWLAPVKIRRTLIGGSRRMIVYDDVEPSEKVKVYDRGVSVAETSESPEAPDEIRRLLLNYRMGDVWAPQLSVKEALLTEIEHFVDCIEQGKAPMTGGASGLHVVTLLEGASQSLKRRGHPVELVGMRQAS